MRLTRDEYLKTISDVIYLSGCAVNGIAPDDKLVSDIDLEDLFKVSEKHRLSSIVGFALESVEIHDHRFVQARAKAIRKAAVMEIEKNNLFKRLEQEKIWYAPLKGIIIKDLYPSIGLRQMSDYDILFDKKYAQKVREIMTEQGFKTELFGKGSHDVYYKPPVCNFEMHTVIFDELHEKKLCSYYRDVNKRLIKDSDNKAGFQLSHDDFYIHVVAHEYKHFISGGTGLRSLLDTYVIWCKLGEYLNEEYIFSETQKMDISVFEQKNKQLAFRIFSEDSIRSGSFLPDEPEEKEMFEYIAFSGVYGNTKNLIQHSVNKRGGGKKGKLRYVKNRLFLPMENIKVYYPTFYKHKLLIPFLFFYRLGRAFTVKRSQTVKSIKILRKMK